MNKIIKKFTSFVTLFLIGLQIWGQTVTFNNICYGQPIALNCSFVIGGCGGMQSTYHWENFSGSWTRQQEPNPTIYVGEQGYAADKFYLSIEYAPPQGGFSSGRVTMAVYPQIIITPTITPATCLGVNDGAISLSVSGGSFPYTYLWDDGVTTKNRTNLAPGDRSLLVTDSKGCKQTIVVGCDGLSYTSTIYTVPSISPFVTTISTTDGPCSGECLGVVEANPTGGTEPYTYLWSNGATTVSIDSLCAGVYTVTITDANNCLAIQTDTVVSTIESFDVAITKNDLRCRLQGSGSVYLWPNKIGTYTYLWSDGNTNRIRQGLNTGTYAVTITNHCGVEVNKSIQILLE